MFVYLLFCNRLDFSNVSSTKAAHSTNQGAEFENFTTLHATGMVESLVHSVSQNSTLFDSKIFQYLETIREELGNEHGWRTVHGRWPAL